MKHFLLLTLLLISLIGYSQSEVSTTNTEYQFLTETYANYDDAELPDGYSLIDLYKNNKGRFIFNYQRFVKDNKTRAVFITINKVKKKDDKVRYLCMPINNIELFKKFTLDTEKLGASMALNFEALNQLLLSSMIDEKFNKD